MTATLGIDLAKATFDVALIRPDGKRRHKTFPNTPSGHEALLTWLTQHEVPQVQACLEATGTFGDALAARLYAAHHIVSIVNPKAVHAFAQSQLRRTKTDRVDANVIADFCVAHHPAPWTPWPPEVSTLQALVRRHAAVQDLLLQERNRRSGGELVTSVAASLARVIANLEDELAALDRQIRDHIDQHPSLRAQHDLLVTIPGIGATTAARLLAECRSIAAFASARAYAAFAGLVPKEHQSGTFRGHTVLSKLGSARLRKALYFPALTAIRHNAPLKQFAHRLRHAGKSPMVIVGAVMRKLLHMVYGVLKHRRAFDPTIVGA